MLRIVIASYIDFTGMHQKFEYIVIYCFRKMFRSATKYEYVIKTCITVLCIKYDHHIIHRFLQGYIKNLNIIFDTLRYDYM